MKRDRYAIAGNARAMHEGFVAVRMLSQTQVMELLNARYVLCTVGDDFSPRVQMPGLEQTLNRIFPEARRDG